MRGPVLWLQHTSSTPDKSTRRPVCPQCFRAHLHPVVSIKLKQRQLWPCKIFLWLCRYYQLKLCTKGRGQQCSEFLTSVFAVECTRMQQLPTMLIPALHRGKDTTHKTLKTMLRYALRFGDHKKKEMLGVVGWKLCLPTSLRPFERGARDAAVARALASHQCDPGLNPGIDAVMWVEFALRGFFYGYFAFPLSSKPSISKFQFQQESGRRRTTLKMCYLQIIIFFILLKFFFI